MPVAPSQSRRALVVGIAGVVVAGGLFAAVVLLTNTRQEIKLGSDRFEAGSAQVLADAIERDRSPIAFADPASGGRPIWLQHLGEDPAKGWKAFDAQVDGCAVDWDADGEEFVDTCTDRRYPADGTGLPQYPVTVEKGRVVVDLRPQ